MLTNKHFLLGKGFIVQQRDMIFLILSMLVVLTTILIPMPSWAMDILLVVNITFSIILLMTVSYIHSPLELSTFPSILLGITMFRLSLNVATTRLILGPGNETRAGSLIQTFGSFVTNSNDNPMVGIIIGLVIFLILVVIQFVVITKGSTRIAEVSARFTLDAMPGKQMAIDADLNAGLIDEDTARRRRENLSRHADFYGSMDGASKFVRGDAIAGLIITAINLIGGLTVGMVVRGQAFSESMGEYTRLTIGDGLVSQLPALIISVGAGILITRSDSKENLGGEIIFQLFTRRSAITGGGIMLVILALLLPNELSFLLAVFGLGMLYYAYRLPSDEDRDASLKRREADARAQDAPGAPPAPGSPAGKSGSGGPEDVAGLLKLDQMELEVGYSLIPLVDSSQGGDLLERITMMRRQLAIELGLLIKPIRVRDNMQLPPNDYSIKLRDAEIARGMVLPDQFLAMDSGVVTEKVDGIDTIEPAFGLPAVWIPESMRETASLNGYTVVDATTVMSTHLTETVKSHAHDILSRQTVSEMLAKQKDSTPAVVEEVNERLRLGEIQSVLKNLLREKVSVRNLETILETLSDYAQRTKDPEILTEYVRSRLGRTICANLMDGDGRVFCVTVSTELEEFIQKSIHASEMGSYLAMDPDIIQQFTEASAKQLERLVGAGHHPVILCSAQIRYHVFNTLRGSVSSVSVISYNEIVPQVKVESLGVIKLAAVKA
ncbi:MAG: flagellar biosynthesis protein FlhA [Planctomycetes bacterium]|nr:flagellar biosynthesis protein FlhA [Planctomycetota bacterium]